MNRLLRILFVLLWMVACSSDNQNGPIGVSQIQDPPKDNVPDEPAISDEELLDLTQRETFKYFWDFAEANTGCARERYFVDDPSYDANTVAIGGTGFGLMAILVGIERNFISRSEGIGRLQQILDFLETADRFHGAWPHWLDGITGKVRPFSATDDGGDIVETAFLVQGLICIREYFIDGNTEEKEMAARVDSLWKAVEWDWYTQNQNGLFWHWSPNNGFVMNLVLKGYNEVLIAYILAAASPDHSITREAFTQGWASDGGIKSNNEQYGLPLLVKHAQSEAFGGPLFWAHYSYLGLDPRGLSDEFANYWDVNVNHSKINYSYCVQNPQNFQAYGQDCWGLTSSYTRNQDGSIGYAAHKPGNDLGIISPTAALSSMPYTPERSMRALRYFYSNKDKLLGPAGFYDAFSPEYNFWVARGYLAIDQGPIIVMIENHRSGMLWNLFMQNEDVQNGLDKLGFDWQAN